MSVISLQYGNFVDNLRLYVRGGSGGMGLPRLGGQGGKGGDVWVVAKKNMTLKRIKDKHPQKRFVSGAGANSRSVHKSNKSWSALALNTMSWDLTCVVYVIGALMFLSVYVRLKGRREKTKRSRHPLESQLLLMMGKYLVCEMLFNIRFIDTISSQCNGVGQQGQHMVMVKLMKMI